MSLLDPHVLDLVPIHIHAPGQASDLGPERLLLQLLRPLFGVPDIKMVDGMLMNANLLLERLDAFFKAASSFHVSQDRLLQVLDAGRPDQRGEPIDFPEKFLSFICENPGELPG